ncbi:MAG: tyrosine--tRNA ligase [Alphaproteobacteria bacterium]|nr:tyrosine--tRNA ligase [Alphaproteobacteria bacterium]
MVQASLPTTSSARSMPRSDFLAALTERGFVHQCTDTEGLDARAAAGPIRAYIGFDCTADSLHVGSLVQIMMLHWLQKTGHKPIVLMGGGTTKIGDPSGRDETRQLLTHEDIQRNKAGIFRVFEKLLTFGAEASATDAIMVDNDEWLSELKYIPLLREIGRHFSVNRMLTMDSVRLRLEREQPLTFLEFNYMILQSYDFVELSKRYGCVLQMGGSDQWGNIVSGVDLGRRLEQPQLYGLTSPLITTADGAKMGKTAAGAIWLNEERLSVYDYWQFWRNTLDADVGRFLKLFTVLPLDEIARLEALQGAELNEAKKILATEATALLHGRTKAAEAAETARRTFEEGAQAEGLPTVDVPATDLEAGIPAFDLLRRAGLAASGGEARRLVRGGGARLNDVPIGDENQTIGAADLTAAGTLKLSAGRKRHVLVRPA